jgi:putative zinc finger/helix-turn-helix YgiT family protein
MRCVQCKNSVFETTSVQDEVRIGGYVFKTEMPAERCAKCGETYVAGPDLERFDLLVARALATQGVITGAAFRFMRKALVMRAAELGDLLGVRPETISRWETDKGPVDPCAFATLGGMVLDRLAGNNNTVDRLLALKAGAPRAGEVVLSL